MVDELKAEPLVRSSGAESGMAAWNATSSSSRNETTCHKAGPDVRLRVMNEN